MQIPIRTLLQAIGIGEEEVGKVTPFGPDGRIYRREDWGQKGAIRIVFFSLTLKWMIFRRGFPVEKDGITPDSSGYHPTGRRRVLLRGKCAPQEFSHPRAYRAGRLCDRRYGSGPRAPGEGDHGVYRCPHRRCGTGQEKSSDGGTGQTARSRHRDLNGSMLWATRLWMRKI